MNNNVFSFGENGFGKLGLGNDGYIIKNTPTKINDIKATDVACGDQYTVLIAQTLRVHPEDMNNNIWSSR